MKTNICGILLHLVVVGVLAVGLSVPEAVLAQLVVGTPLALVAEAHHALAAAEGARDGVQHVLHVRHAMHQGQPQQALRPWICEHRVQVVVHLDLRVALQQNQENQSN